MKIYIYLDNGNVDIYEVENEFKAREHAKEIILTGLRKKVGARTEWFGPHRILKVCWDSKHNDYLADKYGE